MNFSYIRSTNGSVHTGISFHYFLHMAKTSNKIGLLIDVQNLHHGEEDAGMRVDWPALMADFRTSGKLDRAMGFLADHPGNVERAALFERLGITIHVKRIKRSGRALRADLDVNLAVEAIKLASRVDRIVVACGDEDLLPAWEYLESLGVKVVILGFPHSTANALLKQFPFLPVDRWLVTSNRTRSFLPNRGKYILTPR